MNDIIRTIRSTDDEKQLMILYTKLYSQNASLHKAHDIVDKYYSTYSNSVISPFDKKHIHVTKWIAQFKRPYSYAQFCKTNTDEFIFHCIKCGHTFTEYDLKEILNSKNRFDIRPLIEHVDQLTDHNLILLLFNANIFTTKLFNVTLSKIASIEDKFSTLMHLTYSRIAYRSLMYSPTLLCVQTHIQTIDFDLPQKLHLACLYIDKVAIAELLNYIHPTNELINDVIRALSTSDRLLETIELLMNYKYTFTEKQTNKIINAFKSTSDPNGDMKKIHSLYTSIIEHNCTINMMDISLGPYLLELSKTKSKENVVKYLHFICKQYKVLLDESHFTYLFKILKERDINLIFELFPYVTSFITIEMVGSYIRLKKVMQSLQYQRQYNFERFYLL